jgi:hypothetical protein
MTPVILARNSAYGPSVFTDIPTLGVLVPWTNLESGVPGTTIPITPANSGNIRVQGIIGVAATSVGVQIAIGILADGTPISPVISTQNLDNSGDIASIPFQANFHIGAHFAHTISIEVFMITGASSQFYIPNGDIGVTFSCAIDIQETD